MNTLCTCPKETSPPDSCSKLCGIPGWKSRTALKGNNKKSESTTRLLCLTYSSPRSVLALQTARGSQEEMCFLSRGFQNKIGSRVSVWQRVVFFPKWLSGAVGSRKSCSDPQLIEHLTPNGTDLLYTLSLWCVCVHGCVRTRMRSGTISVGWQPPVRGRVAVALHVETSFLLLEMFLLIWQRWHHSSSSQSFISFLPPSVGNFMTPQMCQQEPQIPCD